MAKIMKIIVKVFWIFIIGSLAGFFIEMITELIIHQKLEIRKGLIYGPLIPVYGVGAVGFYFISKKVKSIYQAFIVGAVAGGICEYLASFFQEMAFGTVSWDYSDKMWNLNGRTSLIYAISWGLIAAIFYKYIYKILRKVDKLIYNKIVYVITVIFSVFMIFNVVISCMAVYRREERFKDISPKNSIDRFLDENYTDELVDKVYYNMQRK